MRMGFTPTKEQQAVIDVLPTSEKLKVTAGAGAGKTATLVQAAEQISGKRVLYTAFNRAIVQDGKEKFGTNTRCLTSHKLAYDAVAKPYLQRLNDNSRMPAREKATRLGITSPMKFGETKLGTGTLARLASDGVENFCSGADEQIDWFHLPHLEGLDKSDSYRLRKMLLPYAQRVWEDLQHTDAEGGGYFPFTPNHFRKIWQLGRPTLPYDVLLVDEAQDTAEVFMDVIRRQHSVQTVLIGDTAQAINEWAGARDAIETFDALELQLTRSFRFGQEIADEGNKWLRILGSEMRITGTGSSHVGPVAEPAAVLTRTNGESVAELMNAQQAGYRVSLAGQKAKQEIEQLCDAADGLKQGKGTWVKALMAFTYWSELQEYAKNEAKDLKPFVQVIDQYGTSAVRHALKGLVSEKQANRVISTAHVSKGLEFRSVRIGNDFTEPTDQNNEPVDPTPQDIKLAYVAVTRAKEALSLGGLSWINDRLKKQQSTMAGVSA